MSTDLISIPLKTTSSEVDLADPLNKLLAAGNVKDNFDKEISELGSLRSQILPKNLNKSPSGLELLKRYYDQIEVLEKKVPFEVLNIQLVWEDAFDKGTLLRSRSSIGLPFLVFERQCVLFNIAALQSQLAAEFRISDSDDDLKTVAKWFQQAAGIFAHMASSISVLESQYLTLDLTPDSLDALSILMLAQAQEIFVTKAIKDRMKDGIIAKLSVQAEDMFSEAISKMTKESVKHQWDRNWLSNVAGKRLTYEGFSQYFQSKVCGAAKRVGEQIARLNLCLELFQKAHDKLQNSNLCSFYVTEANRIVAEAKKDNDFIYHEQIPTFNNLSTIEKVASTRLAKLTPFPIEPLSTDFRDLFASLQHVVISPESLSSLVTANTPNLETQQVPTVVEPDKTTASSSTSSADGQEGLTNPTNSPSPLKIALDASLNAMNYYMQQYMQGRK